jgi:hypothetical protein
MIIPDCTARSSDVADAVKNGAKNSLRKVYLNFYFFFFYKFLTKILVRSNSLEKGLNRISLNY